MFGLYYLQLKYLSFTVRVWPYEEFEINRVPGLACQTLANSQMDRLPECVPFVSQYTDCTDANSCMGCKRCKCTALGRWNCVTVQECSGSGDETFRPPTESDLQDVLSELQNYLQHIPGKERSVARSSDQKQDSLIEQPTTRAPSLLTMINSANRSETWSDSSDKKSNQNKANTEQEFIFRKKRGIAKEASENGSILFHHTLDELNEDTLKNSSYVGTIEAQKVKPVKLPTSRRMDTYVEHNSNLSALDTLHIEFNHPQAYARHVTDNKLDSTHRIEHPDYLSHDKLHNLLNNQTTEIKDKDLSKLVVNELKRGQEYIGDKHAPVMSNITFTPENETLTAIAFIAGNLLNKLWSIEKYESDESMEVEVLKHEKIDELLDLFKEPMTMKQELFIKSALEKLSDAVDKNKDIDSVSLCNKVEDTKKRTYPSNTTTSEKPHDCDKHKAKAILRENIATVSTDAAEKIRHVLDLIKKFKHVQNNLNNLKNGMPLDISETIDKPKNNPNQYGKILEKLTKILIPNKIRNKKKLLKKVKNEYIFSKNEDFVEKVNKLYGIDLENVSLTPKDRLLMDYLLNLEKTPDCLLGTKTRNSAPASKIEGEILFNLSEFFKVRSFVDLLKLIDPQKAVTQTVEVTTQSSFIASKDLSARRNNTSETESNASPSVTLAKTKEKLKSHLKSIIEDLTEIQNAKGRSSRNLSITDLLPCLNNILNGGHDNDKDFGSGAAKKIEEMFSIMQNEPAITLPTRRTLDSIERPKSAIIWERIVKSSDRLPTRRLLDNPNILTFENLKQLMKLSLKKNYLKTYENIEDYTDVQPSYKLIFLKSLRKDSNQLKDVLESIYTFVDNKPGLKTYDANELETYVEQVVHILNIAQRLFSVLKVNKRFELKPSVKSSPKPQPTVQEKSKIHSYIRQHKLTREQILKQLIKNRVQLFISMKETTGSVLDDDISYQIALRALKSLENGDYTLAKELYNALVAHKLQKGHYGGAEKVVTPATRFSVVEPPPVARFEESEQPSQDQLLHQLLNIKNLKLR